MKRLNQAALQGSLSALGMKEQGRRFDCDLEERLRSARLVGIRALSGAAVIFRKLRSMQPEVED